jgi:RNA polymerase sigma-70 factor, ECF subfamily
VHAGDGSFEDWYGAHHHRLVAALTVVTGDVDAGREAVDEACVRAWERWDRIHDPAGYVYRTAVHVARRRARRAGTERRLLARAVSRDHSAPPADLAVGLWEALRALPRREREVVALRLLADLPERRVAELLGIAPGTVARALHDARRTLAGELTPIEDPGGAP